MAITKLAKKQVPKTKAKVQPKAKDQDLVDTYVKLSARVKKLNEDAAHAKFAEAKKLVQTTVDARVKPEGKCLLEGSSKYLMVGAKAKQTTITDKKLAVELLREIMDEDAVWSLVSVTLKTLRDYLTPDQLEQLLEEALTGSRSIQVKG